MKKFILAYYGEPKFKSPAEGAKHMAKWKSWVAGLGDALVDPGTPLGAPKSVSANGVSDRAGPNRLMGFSVVRAESLERALELAKECPYVEHGTIDVAEVMQMKM
jgi:hypothetical protein